MLIPVHKQMMVSRATSVATSHSVPALLTQHRKVYSKSACIKNIEVFSFPDKDSIYEVEF